MPFHSRVSAALIALTRFEAHFDPLGQHVRFFTHRSLVDALEFSGFEATVRRAGPFLVARAVRA